MTWWINFPFKLQDIVRDRCVVCPLYIALLMLHLVYGRGHRIEYNLMVIKFGIIKVFALQYVVLHVWFRGVAGTVIWYCIEVLVRDVASSFHLRRYLLRFA